MSDPKQSIISLASQLQGEIQEAESLWSYLPEHTLTVELVGDYVDDSAPSVQDTMGQAIRFMWNLEEVLGETEFKRVKAAILAKRRAEWAAEA